MGYFPFFIEIGGKKCVVAGGGAAALRRINTLVKFGPQITVIAPAIMSEISSMDGVTCIVCIVTSICLRKPSFGSLYI